MPNFFIDRPIFAWVIALFMLVIGAACITQLPVTQYPNVAPPQVTVSFNYPGASAQVLDESVISIIENELNGLEGMIYMESESQASGEASIIVTFAAGTDGDLARVDVMNRLSRVNSRLPQTVIQQGIRVEETRSNVLMIVALSSKDGRLDEATLGDYIARNVLPELQRVKGVGEAKLFGSELAMRVWLDTDRMLGFGITPDDVNAALRAQNAQIAAGSLGARPNLDNQTISASVQVQGQLINTDQFAQVLLRANPDGSRVVLGDVARIELGAQSHFITAKHNGEPVGVMQIQLGPTGNAIETAAALRERMDQLAAFFPAGVSYAVPYDSSLFVESSISKVTQTLLEAVGLVFLVMLLFLQNIRYTLIPTLVVPVALMGTVAVLYAIGFSINALTMFAMVMAIGILVDDAIMVVENVERLIATEHLSPRDATIKAMGQITGAVIGITVVLVSVFVPMALFGGAVGAIYRQFSVTMVVAMLFSAFLALSLTPALCASLLKPQAVEHGDNKRGLFGLFNRLFNRTARGYDRAVNRVTRRSLRMLGLYAGLVLVVAFLFVRLPTGFLPSEDQGLMFNIMLLPPGASANRSEALGDRATEYFLAQDEVAHVVTLTGFSVFGAAQNVVHSFVALNPWDERVGPEHSADAVVRRAAAEFSTWNEALAIPLNLPPILELGNASGFSLRLLDRAGQGHAALAAARDQLLAMGSQSPVLASLRSEGLPDAPQLTLVVDREKASALGVGFDAINDVLSTALASAYVNDFPRYGRMSKVIVQAEPRQSAQAQDLLDLFVTNGAGDVVPFSAFATTRWSQGPVQLVRFNGYPAIRIAGDAAPGYSTGEAMAELERMAGQLPAGFDIDWTGQSREERLSESQAPWLFAFSMLSVFLCLAALYESWSVPFAVMLSVPLGIIGSLLAATSFGMSNDVYFKVGLIAIIGLSAKNAILIVEFAQSMQAQGRGLRDAIREACRIRFRPILMTSAAFICGVLPLALASGAGAASQQAIGIGVVGGMLSATALAIFFVPTFFMVVRSWFPYRPRLPAAGQRDAS